MRISDWSSDVCSSDLFTAAGGMADMDHAPKVESLHQIDHIGRICVHVIAFARLAGTTVTTPVVRNHPIALTKKEHHLIVPIIGAERPAMMEHDCLRIFGAPILVEDPDRKSTRLNSSH